MILDLFVSLIPTKKNKEEYKKEQQVLYLTENDPEFFQSTEPKLSYNEVLLLYKRLHEAEKKHANRELLYRIYDTLYQKITKNWDKGLDALTPQRRAELLRECGRLDQPD